jgi:hypothetical protein
MLLLAGVVAIEHFVAPVVERWGVGPRARSMWVSCSPSLRTTDIWRSMHVGTGRGNIDTVLIGPAGLFTIEVKSHGGRISSDRIDPAWLRQAYAQKTWLEGVAGRPAAALGAV